MVDSIATYIHEINNSLNNVYMLTQILDEEEDPTVIKHHVNLLKQSIQQIKNIQLDYNEYRKTGKISIKHNMVNLCTMIQSITDEYQQQLITKNIKINITSNPCKVFTDGSKLRQVLSNLISNAIKYNVDNGTINISFTSSADIKISDTGIGMSADELTHLGTPFYRSKRIETNGTGLGFPLAKKIADNLGWRLAVASDVGKGTTVFLSIR